MDGWRDAVAVGADEEGGADDSQPSTLDSQLVPGRGRGLGRPVEGLNNKVKLVTRKSYGFRTPKVAKLALLHNLGDLPEPKHAHRFC